MRVSMASMRDAAKMLAMTPDAVATTAMMTVNQSPALPSAGSAARARAKSSASMISVMVRLPATAMDRTR